MNTTPHTHSDRGARRALRSQLFTIAATATVAAAIVALAPMFHNGSAVFPAAAAARKHSSTRSFTYGWPVKPFDQPHPVRGSFGDPRTTFLDPPTARGLMTGACGCSYHQGIDVAAADGTAVYPVESGVVRTVTFEWVEITGPNGHAFQYWHILPLVHVGETVTREETTLGRIRPGSGHVHLTELQNGSPVNPLAPGHIGPYEDRTAPTVTSISFRTSDTGPDLMPEYLHGGVEIVVAAADMPNLPIAGIWNGLPVSPAKISFRIVQLVPAPARDVVPETVAVDVTNRLPASPNMWTTYARGTHMNMPNFGGHRYWRQPGSYLFKLTREQFDTTR